MAKNINPLNAHRHCAIIVRVATVGCHVQDLFVRHEASRILLEALKHSGGGPASVADLASVPGLMPALIGAVSSMVQV